MQTLNSKSILAKLMATENLQVEQRSNVSTASFDVDNRILTIPVLKDDVSSDVYDLFIGHEVGHALYTPLEGLKQSAENNINKAVINVVEDSRIERKIKMKYPGLRSVFSRAYQILNEEDFFGIHDIDVNEMNFIDRINLYCKCGVGLGIKFSNEERILVKAVESTETFSDVIEVSKQIIKFIAENKKTEEEDQKYHFDQNMAEDYELNTDSNESGYDDQISDEDEDELSFKDQVNQSTSGESNEDIETETSNGEKSNVTEEDIRSYTDEMYKENEKKLFSETKTNYTYANIPELDVEKIILDYKKLYTICKEDLKTESIVSKEGFQSLLKESENVVSYLVKEFELHKNAQQMNRSSISKTGELNMKKIFSHSFTEDIFKRSVIVGDAKSHGLIMFVDWSGSMHTHMTNTIKQLISLILFCRKINIPFDVYAFTNHFKVINSLNLASNTSMYLNTKEGDLHLQDFALMNIFSSKMTAAEFSYAGSLFAGMCNIITGETDQTLRNKFTPIDIFSLHSTPLDETIIAAMSIIPKFREENKLQVVNTVIITDGESTGGISVWKKTHSESNQFQFYPSLIHFPIIIRDKVTKYEVKVTTNRRENYYCPHTLFTHSLINLLRLRTESNVIGFYLAGNHDLVKVIRKNGLSYGEQDKMRAEFRKSSHIIMKNSGYNEYYILKSSITSPILDDEEFVIKENATRKNIANAFSKYTANRISNRVVLNRFIQMIK